MALNKTIFEKGAPKKTRQGRSPGLFSQQPLVMVVRKSIGVKVSNVSFRLIR
jgi:hypothetical protein